MIQNSIDACLLRKTLSGDNLYTPKIQINYDSSKGRISIKDNGTGMSLYQIRKFFSKIGKSYYRSRELHQELKKQGKEYEPISQFGIGFLSVFLVAKRVYVVFANSILTRLFKETPIRF